MRFVVLAHDWPAPHFDLLLDAGDFLRSWKLPADFSHRLGAIIKPNAPHRRHYLDYEGPVSAGRGMVVRWDFGDFEWVGETEARFTGQKLNGTFRWTKTDAGERFGPVT